MDDPPCSSSSSSSLPRPRDVFLNFRGEDIRNNFVCHLHSALKRALVNVYLDDEELKEGDSLSKLFKAIEESKISVVVFSENYATSKWCLNELVKIMDCNVNQKQTVIPIFYRVDPSDVRKQTGSFGQAFDKHELSLGKDNDLVQSWRKALTEASNIVGWHFTKNENDAKLIDEIVESVFNMLLRMSSTSKDSDLVGMESCIKKMELGTPLQMDKVRRIGIWGMGGIGKTTIATAVYDQYRSSFDKVCFVHDVKEKFPKGGVNLLKEILSRLLEIREVCINTLGEGYSRMKELSNTKVLVVLDDVDTRDQINTLLGGPYSFGGGSRIIVTTRHSDILSGFEEHKAELLSESDALTLFCQCAFKTNRPSREFEHLSQRAVKYAEGLPLALKVIGSLLGDMTSAFEWEHEFNKMKDIPNSDIHKALIISYQGLDHSVQKIFLDIACFFRGMALDYVTKVLDKHGFHPIPGIKTLVQRSLVTITESGNIEMHDLLQGMGRHVESGMKDGERRRFWSEDDVVDVLNRTTDTQNVEGLMMELPNKEERHFNAEAFKHMSNLRLLLFTYGLRSHEDKGENHVKGDLRFLSPKLSVLVWHRYPLKCLPSTFEPKNLFQLDMPCSRIEHLWEGYKRASNLTSINLRSCPYLKDTPDLTGLPNLEKLDLFGCPSLTEVHPTVFAHKNLVFLSLARCGELRSLPSTIRMKSLKTLDLSFCVNLEMFPDVPEYMEALSKLKLFRTAIKELPSSIERLRGLESLDMTHCKNLIRLPDSICNLAKLRSLKLVECSELSKLPENIGNMESLLDLEVNRCGLEQFPVSILRLKFGGQLSFRGCKMAAPFSSWPSSIEDSCTDVVHLDFSGCNMIKLSDAIACFPSLKVLNLSSNNLESLPAAMKELGCLERLELNGCRRLISIPELSSSISYINAQDCTDLVTVITPQSPYHIGRCFNFSNCSKVQEDVFRDIAENHFPPQGNPSQPFYFSCPGSEIPEQFIHHNTGASVTAKLPPNWFNNKKSTGFAICAVTNKPQDVEYSKLTAQCLCTFKGDHCKYSLSFCLFNAYFHTHHFDPTKFNGLESNHMLVGYVPWSELGINGEQGNGPAYTEAKFEIELSFNRKYPLYIGHGTDIRSCGVRFFFVNNEEDFGEPMEQVDDSEWRGLKGCLVEPSSSDWTSDTSDEDEQYRELSLVFRGANRPPNYPTIEDHEDTSGQREPLETWEQEVRITRGMMQGCLDDGYDWFQQTSERNRGDYVCKHSGCWAEAIVSTPNDPTIQKITYVGRHTCWKTQPMLTYQVRITPRMWIECPPDGYSWREYDQRDIPGSRYPRRSYYVCTPQNFGGCMAIKEVRCSDDQKILKITYRLRHTCTLPSPSIGNSPDFRRGKNGNDAKLIDEMVESVFNMLLRMSSTSKESDLVGMESCIQKMELGTPLQMDKVRTIGISGMGGIGKTTIATAVYDQYRSSFDMVCFVHDVKEKFPKGGVNLLKEILSRLLEIREVCINTLGEAYSRMKELSNTKVLVVLDDVDTRDQIKTLLGGPSFGGGSRIIVTTRHSDILSAYEEHKAELLSESDALTLFCQCAFKTNRPSREFEHLSQRAVKYAEGLPLALKVIGSLLGDMTSALEWEQELNKMKDILNPDIHKGLIISYRGLDDLAQKIFLDIACFFRGRALDYVTKVLDIHGFHPKPGIKTLVQRSLVTITESGNVEMHDLLQEMGRHVESGMKDGERRRFWSEDDVEDVLNRTTDTQNVEGLMMELPNKEERHFNAEAFKHMRNLRLLLFTYGLRSREDKGENHVKGDLSDDVFNKLLRTSSTSKGSDLVGMESCIKKMELGTPLQMDKHGFHPIPGIRTLVQRSLVTITESGNIEMHDLLQEMGRYVSGMKEGERRRFWSDDVVDVLNRTTEHLHNTEDVANNDMNVSNEELSGLSLRSLKKLCKKRTREMREADDDQTK